MCVFTAVTYVSTIIIILIDETDVAWMKTGCPFRFR